MFAADAELEPRPRLASAFRPDPDQLADAILIDGDEGIAFDHAEALIRAQEGSRVIARNAEGRLGQVIGAEGEELRRFRDLAGAQAGPRQLDHRADLIGDLDTRFP